MHKFVSLHNHSSFSFSDALLSVQNLVSIAHHYGSPAVALTEHGHAASMPLFWKECKKVGIKPIIGSEFYFVWDSEKGTSKKSFHLLINVINEKGWRNFLKLMYLSNVPHDKGGGFYIRPRITEKMLKEHQEGLYVSSSCIQGPIANLLLEDRDMDARIVAEWFKDNIDNFAIEIMPHRLDLQVKVNKRLVEIGKRFGIPVITSLDTHLPSTDYNEAYSCNGDLRRGKVLSDRTTDTLECATDWDLHYKGYQEIIDIYADQGIGKSVVNETLANTLIISDMIDFSWQENYFEAPKFCDNADKVLESLLSKNLVAKFGGRGNIPEEHKKRTRYEFEIIQRMGYANYFLILHDAIDFCKSYVWEDGRKGINVGPGRGSAGGSLLAYILGITKIDPVRYELPFERFLNPERTNTFPDIDVDVEPRGREILINYLKSKWGDTSVVQAATHSEVKIKAALKDAGKWLMVPFAEMNAITAAIPDRGWDENGDPIPMEFSEAVKLPQVKTFVDRHPKLFDIAGKLTGSYRQFGIHAGAVCILPKPAEEMIPVMKKKNDTGADVMVSQWDKNMLESVGVHKYDFLGLSTLEILAECETITGIKVDDIPLDDKKTWKYLQEGKHMLGIFQFIDDKTKGLLRKILPTNLNQLADINTLIRPGADVEGYLKNKKDKKIAYKFDVPEVKDELEKSFGAIIYQENIMNLAAKLAGFTLGEGDLLRRALEKNDAKKIREYEEKFIKGCKYPEHAMDMFEWVGANASYLFNKSHALVYSLVGYWCAYFKANYPEVFLVANINNPKATQKESESEYIAKFIFEAREMGINLDLPKMGLATPKASIKNGIAYYGLAGIRGISDRSAEVLSSVAATGFEDFVDAALAVKSESNRAIINRRHILALCKIGFFGASDDAIKRFNLRYGTEEVAGNVEDDVNESVGFEWYSPLLKFYDKIDGIYADEDQYMLIAVNYKKEGKSAKGWPWTMIKGKTPNGDITGFLDRGVHVTKGDVIIAKYTKKGDSITINAAKLLS